MEDQSLNDPTDIAQRSLRYTRDQLDHYRAQAEDFVREKPAQSLAYALLAGFVLHHLPLGRILGGMTRLVLFAIKPAILVYGAAKLYQASQEEEER